MFSTPERNYLRCLLLGFKNEIIMQKLSVSMSKISEFENEIFSKTNCEDLLELGLWFSQHPEHIIGAEDDFVTTKIRTFAC